MSLTFRDIKGLPLTHEEVDANFRSFFYSSSINNNILVLYKADGEEVDISVGSAAFGDFLSDGGSVADIFLGDGQITGSTLVIDFRSASLYDKDKAPGSTVGVSSRLLADENYITLEPRDDYPFFQHFGSTFAVSSSGILIASGARLEGSITASSGLIGGFEIKDNVLVSKPGGAFASSIFISGSPTNAGTFINSNNFIVQGSGDITGSAVLFTGGKIAGWEIDTQKIFRDDVIINSDEGSITIHSSSFGSKGIQLQDNSGSPRFYAGNGSDNFVQYDGTNVAIETEKLELDANNIEISSTQASMSLGEGNIVMYGDISRIDVGSANKVVLQGGATDNFIRMGSKTTFDQDSVAGIIIGMNNTVPTLDLTKDNTNYVRFDSTNGVDIKTDTFKLDTSFIDIDSSTQRIQIYDTGSAEIIRLGEISNAAGDLYGLKIFDGQGTDISSSIAMFGQQGNKIAGWEVTNTQIRSIPNSGFGGQYAEGETGLVLHSSGRIESSDFVSGLKGYRLDTLGNGSAEFENVRVRGTLRTTVFEKESVNVVGGQLMVSNGTTLQALRSGSAVLAGSVTMSATDTTMSVANASGFARGEILMAKKVDDTGFSVEYLYVTGSKRFSEDSSLAYITGSISGSGNPAIDPDGLAGELYVGREYGSGGPSSISSSISVLSSDVPMPTAGTGESGTITIDSTGSLIIQDIIKIGDERLKITNISGSGTDASASLNVIRDFGDTQPAPHNAGDSVLKIDLDREFLAGLVSEAKPYNEGQVFVSTGKFAAGTDYNNKFAYQYNVSGTPDDNGEYKFLSGSTHVTTNITGSTSLQIYDTDIDGTDRASFLSLFDKGSYIITLIDGTDEWVRFKVKDNPSVVGDLHTFPIELHQDFFQTQSTATNTSNSAIDFWFLSNIQDVSSGYILANANPNDLYTPFIDIVERTGSGVYDLSLKTRLGDLSGLASPYLYGDDEPGFGIYTENGFFRGTITAQTGSIAGILHVATVQGGIETGQKVSIGRDVQGTNDGIHINNNNYWYTDAAFKVGGQNNFLTLDNADDGNLQIRVEDFGLKTDNMIISSSFDSGSIRIGTTATDITETANTGFYVNGAGNFRVGTGTGVASPQYVSWNGTTLTVSGDINVIGGNAATTTNIADAITSGSDAAEEARVNAVATGSVSASSAYSESVDYTSSSLSITSGSFANTTQTLDSKIFTDDRGRITTIPTASAEGLYIGSTNLGYYSGSEWRTYMANNGNFFLTGSSGGYLVWDSDAGNLDVKGTVRATAGDIGGVQINTNKIYVGDGDYYSGSTGFYLDNTGDFSLGDQLKWDASEESLTIRGSITVTAGNVASHTDLSSSAAAASSSAIDVANTALNTATSSLEGSIAQTALTASLSASQAQDGAESTAQAALDTATGSLLTASSASISTLSSSLGAMAAIDAITSGNNTTYIGNEAIVTNLIAANALISTNYDEPEESEIYSDAGMFIDFKSGSIFSPSFVVSGSDAFFKGTVRVGATDLTEDNTINQADILGAGAVNFNPDLTVAGLDGRPGGIKAVYGSDVTTNISYADAAKTQLKLYSSTDSTIGAGWPSFKVNPDARYLISLRVKSGATTYSSGFSFRIQELDTELPAGKTHISHNASVSEDGVVEDTREITSFTTASNGAALDLDNIGLGSTFEEYLFYYTPTETAVYASPIIQNWTGAGTNEVIVDRVHIAPETLVKTKGSVGGWTIDSNAIYRGTELADDTFATSNGQITLGAGFIGAKQFKIASDGDATFRGLISGSTIEIGTTTNNIFKANNNGISLGHATFTSAPFRVTPAGALTANNATIIGNITANDGTIGGWNIDSDAIYSSGSTKDTSGFTTSGITLAKGGSIHSTEFVIDNTGATFKGAITGGSITIGNNFSVDAAGNLTASNAAISGNIVIDSGDTFDAIEDAIATANTASASAVTNASNVANLSTDVSNLDNKTRTSTTGEVSKAAVPTTGSTGLYIGSDYLGYYSGSDWATYMANNGDFFLKSGTTTGLEWSSATSVLTVDGIISASEGYFAGNINAENMTLEGGAFTAPSINGGSLTIGSGNNVFRVATDGDIWLGHETQSSAPFRVSKAGALVATSATVSGTINASAGTFSNNITVNGQLTTSNNFKFGTDVNGTDDGLYLNANNKWFADGEFKAGNANSFVEFDGTSLTISGSIVGSDIAIPNLTNPKFLVGANGNFTAEDAAISGSISATGGTIGGFEIAEGELVSSDGGLELRGGASPSIALMSGSKQKVVINKNDGLTSISGTGTLAFNATDANGTNSISISDSTQQGNATAYYFNTLVTNSSGLPTTGTVPAGLNNVSANFTFTLERDGDYASSTFSAAGAIVTHNINITVGAQLIDNDDGSVIMTREAYIYVDNSSSSLVAGTSAVPNSKTLTFSSVVLKTGKTYSIKPFIKNAFIGGYTSSTGLSQISATIRPPKITATPTVTLNTSTELDTFTEISAGGLQVISSETKYVRLPVTTSGDQVQIGGSLTATGNITAFASSDKNLKENIKIIPGSLDKVRKLRGVYFDWKEGKEEVHSFKGKDIGVVAQDVKSILPEIVGKMEGGYLGVKYDKLTAVLIEAVKELSNKVEELENKLKE